MISEAIIIFAVVTAILNLLNIIMSTRRSRRQIKLFQLEIGSTYVTAYNEGWKDATLHVTQMEEIENDLND